MKCQAFGMSWRERSAKDIWFKSHVQHCNCIVSHSRYLDSIATAHTNQQITNGMQKKWVFIYEWTGYESVGAIHKFIKTWTKFFHFGLCSISFVCYYFQSAYCGLSVVRLTEWSQTESFAQKKIIRSFMHFNFQRDNFYEWKIATNYSLRINKTKRNKFH